MRVLVCGSRDWDDPLMVSTVLQGLLAESQTSYDMEGLVIIEGCARGADMMAHHFYDDCGDHPTHDDVSHEHYPADWTKHGKAAGVIRNQQMLDDGKPELVVAFSDHLADSRGTSDMVRRAKQAGLHVWAMFHG